MAGRSAAVRVAIVADNSSLTRGLNDSQSKLKSFGKSAIKAGAVAGVGAAAGLAVLTKSAVSAASDAQQSLGATETVFGKYADTVERTSNRAAKAYGLSANDYRESANLVGSLLKNQGVQQDKLAGQTKNLVGTAADLSATFGGPTSDAVDALGAALKGEFDSLEKYGISLKQSTVNTEAMRIANVKTTADFGKLSTAQQTAAKRQATTNLIMKQSKDAAGAFGRESNTLAHQQQVLGAQFENIKATVGTALLPILTKAASFLSANMGPAFAAVGDFIKTNVLPPLQQFGEFLNTQVRPQAEELAASFQANVLPALQEFGTFLATTVVPKLQALGAMILTSVIPAVMGLSGFLSRYSSIILPVVAGIVAMVAAFKTYQAIMNVVRAVTVAYTAVQAALNVVLTANPIGLIVLALVGLGVALVVAYKKSETFRNIVDGAFGAIKKVVIGSVNAVKTVITTVWNFIKTATTTTFNAIKSTITTVGEAIKTAVGRVLDTVRGIKDRILGVFTGAGTWLLDIGKDIIGGLIDGITGAFGALKDKLSFVTDLIPDWKGPPSKDKTLLQKNGELIMAGLNTGILQGAKDTKKMLGKVTSGIAATPLAAFTGQPVTGGSGAVGTPAAPRQLAPRRRDQITVLLDGQEIASHLDLRSRQFAGTSGGRTA